jgi:hypothetical protein
MAILLALMPSPRELLVFTWLLVAAIAPQILLRDWRMVVSMALIDQRHGGFQRLRFGHRQFL